MFISFLIQDLYCHERNKEMHRKENMKKGEILFML